MAQRALVLGSQVGGLHGVDNDAQRMAEMLEARGFEVDLRTGAAATRDGMLAGYDQLIAASGPEDAAVVYYCGHGYHAVISEEKQAWQCIVPTDHPEGMTTDWRGITGWELSIKQAQLTARTRNTTVILDCCHSAQLSRSDGVAGAVARALPHPVQFGFDRHLAALRARYGAAFDEADPVSNPHAVRIVACGQTETAFEYPDADGVYHGAFTEALIGVLAEVGDAAVSWAAIAGAIRMRVQRRFRRQRPEIEGPVRRGLFSLVERDDVRSVAVTAVGGQLRLSVGELTGAVVGDVYRVWRAGVPIHGNARAHAEVEITEVFATAANARYLLQRRIVAERGVPVSADMLGGPTAVPAAAVIVPTSDASVPAREASAAATGIASTDTSEVPAGAVIPAGAVAVAVSRCAPRWTVAIDAEGSPRAMIEAAIASSSTLRVARPGELGALATLRVASDQITVDDAGGPLAPPAPFPGRLEAALALLANLGVAQGLRELEGANGVAAGELAIDLGVVRDGQPQRLPEHGAVLGLRDRYCLSIERRGDRTLFVHALNISARGKIVLLTHFAQGGVVLDSRRPSLMLGQRADRAVIGVGLKWPDGLPGGGLRLTEFVVIATPVTTDVSGLETRDVAIMRRGGHPLQSALAQLCDGQQRGAHGSGAMDGFLVKRLSILLAPDDSVAGGDAR